jgi:hypothetical protein
MNIGMLWFDNDPKADLPAKIERAAKYYQNKYGKRPTLCFVHPSHLPGNGNGKQPEPGEEQQARDGEKEGKPVLMAANVEVRATRSVLPNHLWIGVGAANGQAAA